MQPYNNTNLALANHNSGFGIVSKTKALSDNVPLMTDKQLKSIKNIKLFLELVECGELSSEGFEKILQQNLLTFSHDDAILGGNQAIFATTHGMKKETPDIENFIEKNIRTATPIKRYGKHAGYQCWAIHESWITPKNKYGRKTVTAKTEEEAIAKAEKKEREAVEGTLAVVDYSFKVYYNLFMARVKKLNKKADSTINGYRKSYNRYFAKSNFSNKDIREVTEDAILDFFEELFPENVVPAQRYYDVESVLENTMEIYYRHCRDKKIDYTPIDWGFIRDECIDNLFSISRKPKNNDIFALSEDEMKLFHTQCIGENTVKSLVTLFALYTALRLGELCAITWKDIDLAQKQYTVNKSLKYEGGKWIIGEPKTQNSNATIGLNNAAIEILEKLKSLQLHLGLYSDDGRIAYDGEGYMYNKIGKGIEHICERAGISKARAKEISMHQLRKSFSTFMLDNGESSKRVAEFLRNTVRAVEQSYTKRTSNSEATLTSINNALERMGVA